MEDNELRDKRGGFIIATSDTNREEPDYLLWQAPAGYSVGIIANTPETRRFLQAVLRRFRRDAARLGRRAAQRTG